MSPTGPLVVPSFDLEMIDDCWTCFQQSYRKDIERGALTKRMVKSAAGIPGDSQYSFGRRLYASGDNVFGAMVTSFRGLSIQIEWLGVMQDSRRCGVASLLVDELKSHIFSQDGRASLTADISAFSSTSILGQISFWKAMDFDIVAANPVTIVAIFDWD